MISVRTSGRTPRAVILVVSAVMFLTTVGTASSAAPAHETVQHTGSVSSACRAQGQDAGLATAGSRLGRGIDQKSYTQAQVRSIDRQLRKRLAARSTNRTTARFGLILRIPVHAHVIDGWSSRGPSKKQALRQLAVLNRAYGGGQSTHNTRTLFAFYLDSFDRVRNQRWRNASLGDPANRELRRALHEGGPASLNLYLSAPVDRQAQDVLLGWSSFPWDARRHPRQDGVTIHQETLPGGDFADYNRGDTTVHEVGHWLGLLHTFEGGCSTTNDLVDDTPAEFEPSSTCDMTKNTCPAPGLDPVHNFMDYAVDSCMNMFTPGQVSRVTDNWLAYRTP